MLLSHIVTRRRASAYLKLADILKQQKWIVESGLLASRPLDEGDFLIAESRNHDSGAIDRRSVYTTDFSVIRFFIYFAPSATRPRNFVCDPRAVASCAITSICIRIHSLSSTSSILPHFSPFFLSFSPLFLFSFFPMSTLFRQLGTFLLYFPFSPRRGLVSFVCTSHFRTPANSHEPLVPIKPVGIVFKLVRAFASYLYVRSSLLRRSLDRSWSLCRSLKDPLTYT